MNHTERTLGYVHDTVRNVPCNACGGIGEIDYLPRYAPGVAMNNPYTETYVCPTCDGYGVTLDGDA